MAKFDISDVLQPASRKPALGAFVRPIRSIAKGAIAGIGIALAIVGVQSFFHSAEPNSPVFPDVDAVMTNAAWIGALLGALFSWLAYFAANK